MCYLTAGGCCRFGSWRAAGSGEEEKTDMEVEAKLILLLFCMHLLSFLAFCLFAFGLLAPDILISAAPHFYPVFVSVLLTYLCRCNTMFCIIPSYNERAWASTYYIP